MKIIIFQDSDMMHFDLYIRKLDLCTLTVFGEIFKLAFIIRRKTFFRKAQSQCKV